MSDEHWFTDRPRRTQKCPRCNGCGRDHLPYALAPAEYVLDAPNNAIRAQVVGSFDIYTACREASEIAKESNEPVAFDFNEICVVVKPNSDPDKVARDWWKKAYDETPEQTWARR